MFNTIIRTFYNNTKILLGDDVLLVLYWDGNNWGDALNPMLIQKISGKHPLLVTRFTLNITDKPVFSVIGSILGNTRGGKNLVIWGTGFISNKGRLRVRPKQIYAVRGPLTRELILKQGFECPKIYGDPALLYPRFYRQDIPKKYKLGIIPHFIDKNDTRLHDVQQNADVIIIDIQGGIHEVVDNICSCKNIASSSLHGIIAADAYGIPSTWIKLSDGVRGEGFKFFDYFKSVGRTDEGPFIIREKIIIDAILDRFYSYKLEIDLKELWEACPFRQMLVLTDNLYEIVSSSI